MSKGVRNDPWSVKVSLLFLSNCFVVLVSIEPVSKQQLQLFAPKFVAKRLKMFELFRRVEDRSCMGESFTFRELGAFSNHRANVLPLVSFLF